MQMNEDEDNYQVFQYEKEKMSQSNKGSVMNNGVDGQVIQESYYLSCKSNQHQGSGMGSAIEKQGNLTGRSFGGQSNASSKSQK